MGALCDAGQRDDVLAAVAQLRKKPDRLCGDPAAAPRYDGDAEAGAFMAPFVLRCDRPLACQSRARLEAFGPVRTLMAYDGVEDAIEIANRGDGSLVASVFSYDDGRPRAGFRDRALSRPRAGRRSR